MGGSGAQLTSVSIDDDLSLRCSLVEVLQKLRAPPHAAYQLFHIVEGAEPRLLDHQDTPRQMQLPQFSVLELRAPAVEPEHSPATRAEPVAASSAVSSGQVTARAMQKHVAMAGRSVQAAVRGETAKAVCAFAEKHSLWIDGSGAQNLAELMGMVSEVRAISCHNQKIRQLRATSLSAHAMQIAAEASHKQGAAERLEKTIVRWCMGRSLLPVPPEEIRDLTAVHDHSEELKAAVERLCQQLMPTSSYQGLRQCGMLPV